MARKRTWHTTAIAKLGRMGLQTKGFRDAILAEVDDPDTLALLPRIVPDAYRIDPFTLTVVAWEVTDANPITERRLKAYADLFDALDADGAWTVTLIEARRTASDHLMPINAWNGALLWFALLREEELMRTGGVVTLQHGRWFVQCHDGGLRVPVGLAKQMGIPLPCPVDHRGKPIVD